MVVRDSHQCANAGKAPPADVRDGHHGQKDPRLSSKKERPALCGALFTRRRQGRRAARSLESRIECALGDGKAPLPERTPTARRPYLLHMSWRAFYLDGVSAGLSGFV